VGDDPVTLVHMGPESVRYLWLDRADRALPGAESPVTRTPAITSSPPARTAAVARSPRKTIAPSTLTTGSRYNSRLILVLPPRTIARFHSSIPATVLPRARNSISAQAG
jgi:hypothetical protein